MTYSSGRLKQQRKFMMTRSARMTTTTERTAKTLADIASEDGIFSIIAMDQRNTLRRMFVAAGLEGTVDQLRDSKVAVARALTPYDSGILFDPTYGVPAATDAAALESTSGLLVAAEPAERGVFNGEPRTHRDPALNGQWVLDQGGDAVKFFVQLRADRPTPGPGEPDLVAEVLQVTREVVDDAHSAGVPAVIENLIYPLPGRSDAQQREDAIVEAARALNDIDGVDLLKLEYPGSVEGTRRLASVLTRPWAVLSAGVPFEQFTDVLQVAFDEGGASGFIAGRSVWKESIGLAGTERDRFLADVARPRLHRLVEVAATRATPWTSIASH
jgi:tagatose 1,6-diphosphate aldolase/sulfofructosephosphate aldolase